MVKVWNCWNVALRPHSLLSRRSSSGRLFSFLGLVVLLTLGLSPPGAYAQGTNPLVEAQDVGSCGNRPITIARMQWPSSILLAYVHALILEQELGCSVQIVPGDLAASVSSMATTGQPAVAPEMWITRVAAIWNSMLETGQVRSLAPTFSGGAPEGWYLPQHVAMAEPGLNRAGQLKEYAQRLESEGVRPKFISCPADWACSVVNRNLLRAYGLERYFDVVEPGNRFEMDNLIAQSVSRSEPVVFYYWQPNSILAQFDFKALDMGPFDQEKFSCLARRACAAPETSSFVDESVFIVISDWVIEEAPMVMRYFQRATMPVAEMSQLLANQAVGGRSYEDVAARFVRERKEVWQAWVAGL